MIRFYKYRENETILVCEECKNKDIENSKSGNFVGDEIVREKDVSFAGNHGQCDNCLTQCDDYPDCEYS